MERPTKKAKLESESDSEDAWEPGGEDVSFSELGAEDRLLTFNTSSNDYKLTNQPGRYTLESDDSLTVGGNTSAKPFTLSQYVSELESLYNEDLEFEDQVEEVRTDVPGHINAGRVSSHYWMMSSVPIDEYEVNDSQANAKADGAMKLAIQAKGIVQYLKDAVKDKNQRTQFKQWWSANSANQQWLENAFRAADAGKHEWIPSDMIPDVLEFDADNGASLDWVTLQNVLRSKTADIIFKPSKAEADPGVNAHKDVLQGHSGALYVKKLGADSYKPATKGQPAFHNELRDAFKENRDDGVEDTVRALKGVFESWVWDGSTAAGDVHDSYFRKPSGGAESSAADLKGEQVNAHARILQSFQNLLKG